MSGFSKLSKAFDESTNNDESQESKTNGLDTINKSLAIVRAIDKLKSQGIAVTKKAELDYILALRTLERAGVDLEEKHPIPSATSPIKRNPKDHPQEFRVAMEYSQKTVTEIEEKLKQGISVANNQLEEYKLCKKFLEKYLKK